MVRTTSSAHLSQESEPQSASGIVMTETQQAAIQQMEATLQLVVEQLTQLRFAFRAADDRNRQLLRLIQRCEDTLRSVKQISS